MTRRITSTSEIRLPQTTNKSQTEKNQDVINRTFPTNSKASYEEEYVWRNPQAEVIEKFECVVPVEIHNIIRSINQEFPNDEFSVFLKVELDFESRQIIVDRDKWYIPRQEVSGTFVDYKEDDLGFNGVMHKHPKGVRSFSSTDKAWINQNFEVSLLWIYDEWVTGIVNLQTPAGRVQLPVKVYEEETFIPNEDVKQVAREKIAKKTYTKTASGKSGGKSTSLFYDDIFAEYLKELDGQTRKEKDAPGIFSEIVDSKKNFRGKFGELAENGGSNEKDRGFSFDTELISGVIDEDEYWRTILDKFGIGLSDAELFEMGFEVVEWNEDRAPTQIVVDGSKCVGKTWEDHLDAVGIGLTESQLEELGFEVIDINENWQPKSVIIKEQYNVFFDPFGVDENGNSIVDMVYAP